MNGLKINILANFSGQTWSALLTLALVPVYIKFLGIEAYGLIGFFAMLQGMLVVLDLGLGQTLNRELARYSALSEKASEVRNFVRTLEVGYWVIGIVIGTALLTAAPFIATHWITAGAISVNVLRQAVMIMGIVIALHWPISFYQSGLMGLQRQVLLNSIKIGMSTFNGVGAVLILALVSPTITAFFAWQIVSGAASVILFAIFLWRRLPPSKSHPRITPNVIRNIWRFAAGLSGITLSAIILTQLDKVILSNLLNLKMFGYYTLAGVVARALYMFITPVFNTLFPRFSALAAADDHATLARLYRLGSQFMATLILPMAAVLALFSYDILLLWTGSTETATNASPIVRMLVIGTALNGLMNLPYALQLAHGWTSIGLCLNILFIVMLGPAIFFTATYYGAAGAASVWVVLNGFYMLIGVPLTHRRLLKGEAGRWLVEGFVMPLSAVLLVVGFGRWLIITPMSSTAALVSLAIVLFTAWAAAAFSAPQIRSWLLLDRRKQYQSMLKRLTVWPLARSRTYHTIKK